MSLKPQIDQHDYKKIISKSSLHPYLNKCEYSDKIFIPNATGLWIIFHANCELNDQFTKLTFYKDSEKTIKISEYSGKNFLPLIVNNDYVYFTFSSDVPGDVQPLWGYHFFVYPIMKMTMRSESMIISNGCIEWVCFLMNYCINNQSKHLGSNVYNMNVYNIYLIGL